MKVGHRRKLAQRRQQDLRMGHARMWFSVFATYDMAWLPVGNRGKLVTFSSMKPGDYAITPGGRSY